MYRHIVAQIRIILIKCNRDLYNHCLIDFFTCKFQCLLKTILFIQSFDELNN